MDKMVLQVEGMSCSHCEHAIKTAVGALDGVDRVTVDLSAKAVTVDYNPATMDLEHIKAAIEDQGYDVV